MEIEFTLKREEYEEFVKAAYSRISRISKSSGKMFTANIMVWVFFGLGFAGVIHFYEKYQYLDFSHLNIAFLAILIGVSGFIAANIFQQKMFIKHSIDENGRMLKPQKLEISERGLTYKTADCVQSYEWAAIQDLEETKNLYCFYIDNNQALLIPKRSVTETGKTKEFQRYANIAKSSNK